MVEFNLLPDVKVDYLHTRTLKRTVVTVSIIVGGAFLAIFIILLLFVEIGQKVRIHSLNSSIKTASAQLEGNANLNKILTVQNQLKTLPTLEAQTPISSRLFGYVSQITPAKATVSSLQIDFTSNTITMTGAADSLATVNQFVDTLKFTAYTNGTNNGSKAFSDVVLSSFNYSSRSGNSSPAQYTITFKFDPTIFKSTDNVKLVVPSITTTRSVIDQPTDLFKAN